MFRGCYLLLDFFIIIDDIFVLWIFFIEGFLFFAIYIIKIEDDCWVLGGINLVFLVI